MHVPRLNVPGGTVADQVDVGTHALTLITPLSDCEALDGFHLVYQPEPTGKPRITEDLVFDEILGTHAEALKQYTFQRGKSVVFGASFLHSTQPGRATGKPYVYLCFCVGTDKMHMWPAITATLGGQARVIADPQGSVKLTAFGMEFEQRRNRQEHGDVEVRFFPSDVLDMCRLAKEAVDIGPGAQIV